MKKVAQLLFVTTLAAASAFGSASAFAADAAAPAAPAKPAKNWTAPANKIYAQQLSDAIMAAHPELLSVTFHGVPPDAAPKTYTMFAGSYPERIGNPDDPDDVMIIETGITILDARWHRTKDVVKKYVPMLPLRDAAGENIGLLVLAYKNPYKGLKTDMDFFKASTALRDKLQKQIPSYAALFAPAK